MAEGSFSCPGCGANLKAEALAAYSPEVMTVVYKMEAGRKMPVEDFCKSLEALAKSLKLIAKELGASVLVSLEAVSVTDSEVAATVCVSEIKH